MRMLRVGIVAGEDSGDLLGAGLISALRERHGDIQVEGIAGPRMRDAGCRAIYQASELSVMGLAEAVVHYPRLSAMRRRLAAHFMRSRPDVFVGVDAPDFNLGLERRLKAAGIPVVHMVSPSVWAWRGWRRSRIARSADLLLTLFPFEADLYAGHPLQTRYTGHPLADAVPAQPDRAAARQRLGLPADACIIGLLPGSRVSEVGRLAGAFFQAAGWCAKTRPGLQFALPVANEQVAGLLDDARASHAQGLTVHMFTGRSREVMEAADALLVASGTAALEAMLLQRPMVVAYRVAGLTGWLMQYLARTDYLSLPNHLTPTPMVPEYFQHEVSAPILGRQLMHWLEAPDDVAALEQAFDTARRGLQQHASRKAADAVLELAG